MKSNDLGNSPIVIAKTQPLSQCLKCNMSKVYDYADGTFVSYEKKREDAERANWDFGKN
jgi:hypothetical protein